MRGSPMLRGETAILAGRGRDAFGPERRPARMPKCRAKKTGAGWPRSNNDKRRMVTRRRRRTRTVKKDSGVGGEFEKFFDRLTSPAVRLAMWLARARLPGFAQAPTGPKRKRDGLAAVPLQVLPAPRCCCCGAARRA
ncbi:hypothetical protein PSAC2689_20391 [Paraburkholderia sacchari]